MTYHFLDFLKPKPTNFYSNRLLQFRIEKPADWVFVPQKWAYQFNVQHKWQINKLNKVLSQGVMPFVYFYKKLTKKNRDYPCPTVQCGCRLNHLPKDASREEQMEQVIREVTQPFRSFEILATDPEYKISGHRGMMVQLQFSVKNDQKKILKCLAKTILVEYRDYLIVIGMTASEAPEYRFEKEFEEILDSIEIGD
jgi:hypothetical protein